MVLPSEMDLTESGIVQKAFIKRTSFEIFLAKVFVPRHVRAL
jgi:hypothetical protein